MPTAMVDGFNEMSVHSKCDFLLSGLNNCYVQEWDVLYGAIAQFVWDLYRYRDEKHKYLSDL